MKCMIRCVTMVALLACLTTGYGYWSFRAVGPLSAEKTLYFERGTGFLAMTQALADEGVLREPWTLRLVAVATGGYKKFQAGEYAFTSGITVREVLAKCVRGEQVLHKITIPEGLTTNEILELLAAQPLLVGTITEALGEGTLLPDTYVFLRGDERSRLIAKMQDGLEAQMDQAWESRAPGLPLATPQEALVLASIVEKETGRRGEREQVAGVFINRLRMGMKLQSDPTTAYAVSLADGWMQRPLTYTDLKRDLPHNTYVVPGLPPTPICNPGVAAINAVLHPQQTDAFYFVADGNGGHRFSATIEEHTQNVLQYRALQK